MSPVHTPHEPSCPGCGKAFRLRNEIELAWRDKRFCSSRCQRHAGLSGISRLGNSTRPARLAAATRRIDRLR